MVQLFLSKPDLNDNRDSKPDKMTVCLLNDLESIIWSVMVSEGRSEARLWLCRTISRIKSVTHHRQRQLFVNLLKSKPLNKDFASQLIQMLFERRPHKVGAILSKKSYVLGKFFEGDPRRVFQWFANFSGTGLENTKGARALSQFAFVNRDICWEELEWKGKHGQSPAMVATKPHYFLDLDVQRTVENFLENVPEFWSSNEFADSLKDGEILFIDRTFFAEFFVNLMFKEDSEDVWEVVNEFLLEESFSCLCQHLLITLKESDFCMFLELLQDNFNNEMKPEDFGNSSYWIEILLSKSADCKSIHQFLLLNAVINQGRQLLRLLHDEEFQEAKEKVKVIVSQICSSCSNDSLAPILRNCVQIQTVEAVKLLALQSWVLHYKLEEECQTPESWESLFVNNGIGFRRSDEYVFVNDNRLLNESGSEMDASTSSRRYRKKGKSRKRKQRNFDSDDRYEIEMVAFDSSDHRHGSKSRAGSWSLSTDGFSASWTNVDLPEHISKHCLCTWMKWLFFD